MKKYQNMWEKEGEQIKQNLLKMTSSANPTGPGKKKKKNATVHSSCDGLADYAVEINFKIFLMVCMSS